jgi:hypothetical protein
VYRDASQKFLHSPKSERFTPQETSFQEHHQILQLAEIPYSNSEHVTTVVIIIIPPPFIFYPLNSPICYIQPESGLFLHSSVDKLFLSSYKPETPYIPASLCPPLPCALCPGCLQEEETFQNVQITHPITVSHREELLQAMKTALEQCHTTPIVITTIIHGLSLQSPHFWLFPLHGNLQIVCGIITIKLSMAPLRRKL